MVRGPYHRVVRLIGILDDDWEAFDARYAKSNINLWDLPIRRVTNLVYYTIVDSIGDENDRARFDEALNRPPIGKMDAESPAQAEDEMALFRAAFAGPGGS